MPATQGREPHWLPRSRPRARAGRTSPSRSKEPRIPSQTLGDGSSIGTSSLAWSTVKLNYEVPAAAAIALKIYDRSGRVVASAFPSFLRYPVEDQAERRLQRRVQLRQPVRIDIAVAVGPRLRSPRRLDLNACAFREPLDGLRKRQTFAHLDELQHVAAGAARKALENLLRRADVHAL